MSDSKHSDTQVTRAIKNKDWAELERRRRTLVVMFSDIQGSTAYFEKYGDVKGLFMVHQCNDVIRRRVQEHGGTVIKTIGDGTMMTFPEAESAVKAAIEIQTELTELNAASLEHERIALRIGMHYGTGIVRTNDVMGDVVNMASRVESVATAGQILLSEEMYEKVHESGFTIRELGRFTLKGKGERTLFQVIWRNVPGATTDFGVGTLAFVPTFLGFKLQLVRKDGSGGEEYAVPSELGIARSPEREIVVCKDVRSASCCARVFVQDQRLFVEELGASGEGVFLRLAGAYTLEHRDIFLAGQQVFRFEEKPASLSSITDPGTGLAEIDCAMRDAAELVRIDAKGNATARYPLNAPEVLFGRTRGAYVFTDDNLMSRAHVRISQRGEDFLLEDVGSRNGTFVKVRGKTAVPAGAALLIGGQLLRVVH